MLHPLSADAVKISSLRHAWSTCEHPTCSSLFRRSFICCILRPTVHSLTGWRMCMATLPALVVETVTGATDTTDFVLCWRLGLRQGRRPAGYSGPSGFLTCLPPVAFAAAWPESRPGSAGNGLPRAPRRRRSRASFLPAHRPLSHTLSRDAPSMFLFPPHASDPAFLGAALRAALLGSSWVFGLRLGASVLLGRGPFWIASWLGGCGFGVAVLAGLAERKETAFRGSGLFAAVSIDPEPCRIYKHPKPLKLLIKP